jgi:hypothetical protein
VIISNSNHRSIRALYRQYDARFKMLARPSVIAAKSEHRRSVREILVIMSAGLGANHFG